MRVVVVAGILLLIGGAASPNCSVDCPDGYLGVCVERGARCLCKCAKDVSAGTSRLGELLREGKASDQAVEEALRQFESLAEGQTKSFSFSIRDGGVTFNISARWH
jgi:hypothetical protein